MLAEGAMVVGYDVDMPGPLCYNKHIKRCISAEIEKLSE